MKRRGFSLLEMMIATAILSGALTWIVAGMSRNIKAENHAKLLTTATFLARAKMTSFEDDLYEKGFGEFDKGECGSFEDKGFQRFGWCIKVDKVVLPGSDQVQTMMTKVQEMMGGGGSSDSSKDKPGGTSPTSATQNPLSAGAGMMASQFGIIKDVLEQAIRRVTVTITWKEGRTPKDLTVVAYFTDVKRVDQAIMISGQPPP